MVKKVSGQDTTSYLRQEAVSCCYSSVIQCFI